MSTIKVICIDQTLAFENTPVIASGGREDYVSFTFCEKWEGYSRTAVFWRNEADAYHVLMGTENTCQIPPEVTGDEGVIFFGVFGVNGEAKQRTSNVLTYRIEKGAITVASAPSDPTPGFYTQLLAMERAFEEEITRIVVDNTIPDGTLTTVKMANKIVTTEKLADKSVTAEKLAAGAVTTEKLAAEAVTAEKMAAGSVPAKAMTEAAIFHTLSKGLQMATGSYVGTGEYGADHPNTLTFDFVPKLVVIVANSLHDTVPGSVFIEGQTESDGIGNHDNPAYGLAIHISWNGKTVSWHSDAHSESDADGERQLNKMGFTYHYAAFGMGV